MEENAVLKEIKEMRRELQELALYNKPVLSFPEFCRFAKISEHRGRAVKKQGNLPFTRPFGRKLYITREDAIACLMQNPVGNSATIEQMANHHLLNTKKAL